LKKSCAGNHIHAFLKQMIFIFAIAITINRFIRFTFDAPIKKWHSFIFKKRINHG